MAVSDEIAANSAYKVRHVEDYPPKNPTYNKMPRRRTPLSSHMRIPRVQLLSLALLPSDSCTRFSAPTLLYSGPMTAFAGIFVQPHYTCARANSTSCIPSSSVTNVRNMLESCDNRARSEKRNGKMFCRHAEWPKVADAVIEAKNSSIR
jgi:hypothetical protein